MSCYICDDWNENLYMLLPISNEWNKMAMLLYYIKTSYMVENPFIITKKTLIYSRVNMILFGWIKKKKLINEKCHIER
jgi:hypothetical protein